MKLKDIEHLLSDEEREKIKHLLPKQSVNGREMSKTEARYADMLERSKLAGEIIFWEYEPRLFVLSEAADCTFTPDFLMQPLDGKTQFHEVKGKGVAERWEDSVIKLKWVASLYHEFEFYLVKRKNGGWSSRLIPHD